MRSSVAKRLLRKAIEVVASIAAVAFLFVPASSGYFWVVTVGALLILVLCSFVLMGASAEQKKDDSPGKLKQDS
jgi:hypothetical protein